MSPSAQHTSEQLKEIVENEKKTDQRSKEVQEQVEDGEDLRNPDNFIPALSTVLNTINNRFEH
jgi:hypothetical protein